MIVKRIRHCLVVAGGAWLLLGSAASAQPCVPTQPFETRTAALPNACGDTVDNDCDGYIDGADDSCRIETRWATGSNYCNDGYDNDGDGYVDGQGGTPVPTPLLTQTPIPDPECRGEVYCNDGVDNDGDGLTDANDFDCRCMTTATGSSQNCTSNDFNVAFTAAPEDITDGCINTSDFATVRNLLATVNAAQPDRPDISLWVALDGLSDAGGTGRCLRQILTPVTTTPFPPGTTFINAPGPYPILEPLTPQDQRDTCGDLGGQIGASYRYPMPVTVPCNDVLTNGFVDLGQCGAWNNNDQNICSSVHEALPQTKAKCQCATKETGLPGPHLEMACSSSLINQNPAGNPLYLEPGESSRNLLLLFNDVANCNPTNFDPAPLPPNNVEYGTRRCGTASFVAYVVDYSSLAAQGVTGTITDLANDGLFGPSWSLFNDTTNQRIIFVPHNHLQPPTFTTPDPTNVGAAGVVSPNWATPTTSSPRNARFDFVLTSGPSGLTNVSLPVRTYWNFRPIDTTDGPGTGPPDGIVDFFPGGEWDQWFATAKRQDCTTGCNCNFTFQTTPVTLASFAAIDEGAGLVRFEWSTATEVNHVGFQIWAETPEGQTRLLDEPVSSEGREALGSKDYEASVIVPEDATAFWLVDTDLSGKARRHGPYKLGQRSGERLSVEAVDWREIRNESEAARASRATHAAREAARLGSALSTEARSVDRTLAEIGVTANGIQRLTYEHLLSLGVDLGGQSSQTLALRSADGALVPLFVGGGAKFGPGSYVEFVGTALDTLYTGRNVYRLMSTRGGANLGIDATQPTGAAAAYYMATTEIEHNLDYFFASPIADPFFDTRLLAFTNPIERSFPFEIDGLVAGGAPSHISVRMYGASSTGTDPDHHVIVRLNGVELGASVFDGLADGTFSATIPAGLLQNGTNTLTLRLPADTGSAFDVVNLDGFDVTHPRAFVAVDDRLDFVASGQRFEVAGFSSPNLVAYRVRGGYVERLTGVSVVPNGSSFTAVLPGTSDAASYYVAALGALTVPEANPARSVTNILSKRADLLVISHSDFISGISHLVSARQKQGLRVVVVDVADVFAGYSGGVVDPKALQTYIAAAVETMGIRSVLLVGGDTYDYRNYLGLGAVSFIPSLYVDTGDVTFTPSDAALADLDGDGVQDLDIGRLPVRTGAELSNLVAKILDYDAKDYGTSSIFVADAEDPSTSIPFRHAAELQLRALGPDWNSQRAYVDQLGMQPARDALFAAIDGGIALTSYSGHSGPTNWGDPSNPSGGSMLTTADVAALQNFGMPTVVSQFGCWNTYYVSPRTESLGGMLLLAGDRGAAAVMGATTLTNDDAEALLGEKLTALMTTQGMPLGRAITEAKRQIVEEMGPESVEKLLDVLYGWNLLGDPTMVLQP